MLFYRTLDSSHYSIRLLKYDDKAILDTYSARENHIVFFKYDGYTLRSFKTTSIVKYRVEVDIQSVVRWKNQFMYI